MFAWIKRWYNGEGKIRSFDNDPNSGIVIYPGFYIEFHWTAKVARAFVGFYLRNWKWLWGSAIVITGWFFGGGSFK